MTQDELNKARRKQLIEAGVAEEMIDQAMKFTSTSVDLGAFIFQHPDGTEYDPQTGKDLNPGESSKAAKELGINLDLR